MTGEFAGGGSLNDLPWASVFDPAANARALSAIQAEGFRAASQIVDRFARLSQPDGDAATTADPAPGLPYLEELVRTWWSLAGQLLLDGGRSRATELDLCSPEGQRGVAMELPIPGGAETVVWLHNRTDKSFGRIRLRCSDLLAGDGSVIGSRSVVLDPETVEIFPRCSRGIAVGLEVTSAARPGVYRGIVVIDGDDRLWLPVAITLRAPTS
ncbi:Secreted protein [Mycobacterium sp. smrl_JER01]|uniref:hypothetical protein n=1 Tax=Mycobacterium sp. smrl_JER01 TaxID=3402633 RepID=UPI003D7522C4